MKFELVSCPIALAGLEGQSDLEHVEASDLVAELAKLIPPIQEEVRGLEERVGRAARRYREEVLAEVTADELQKSLARINARETVELTAIQKRLAGAEADARSDGLGDVPEDRLREIRRAFADVAPDRVQRVDRFYAAHKEGGEKGDDKLLVIAAVERAPQIVRESLGITDEILETGRRMRNPNAMKRLEQLRRLEFSIKRTFDRARTVIEKLDPVECKRKLDQAAAKGGRS